MASPRLAPERAYEARDGARLPVRTYGAEGPIDLVLVHGSGAFNAYLADLSAAIADSGAAVVHTPDLRGHGVAPARRGDIDYPDQLEDDLADLVASLQRAHPERAVVVGGHSSGAGLAVRFAGGAHASLADGYLLLAPYLGHDAPTTRPASGGWARARIPRIVALTILECLGIDALGGTTVVEFDLPATHRSGAETPAYSYRMMRGINPRGYANDLAALRAPVLVVVGGDDEAMVASAYPALLDAHAPHAELVVVPGQSHLGLVGDPVVAGRVVAWLRALGAGETAGERVAAATGGAPGRAVR
jgi:alpha-beta hydrolase superfamily lysophospholipase